MSSINCVIMQKLNIIKNLRDSLYAPFIFLHVRVLQSATSRWRYHQHWCHCKLTDTQTKTANINTQSNTAPIADLCLFMIGVSGWLPRWHLRNLLNWRGGWGWAAVGWNCQALSKWGHRCLQTGCTALCYRKHYQVDPHKIYTQWIHM